MENADYQARARLVSSKSGEVNIVSYTPNTIKISYKDAGGETLLLADTWFPGWKAFVNNKEVNIEKCDGIFRCVKLADKDGEVVFDYQPQSFWIGVKISILCGILTLVALVLLRKKK